MASSFVHHPCQEQLERLMRGELPRAEARAIVRHLLTGCPRCVAITRRLWPLGEEVVLEVPLRDGLEGTAAGGRSFPRRV